MKSLWNKQLHQAETKNSRDRKYKNGAEAQDSLTGRQVWEEHQRQSVESVSSANGWMHSGIQNSHFFCQSILH